MRNIESTTISAKKTYKRMEAQLMIKQCVSLNSFEHSVLFTIHDFYISIYIYMITSFTIKIYHTKNMNIFQMRNMNK